MQCPLGKKSEYLDKYDSTLLFPVPRSQARERIAIDASHFSGIDIWNCYEVSWLNEKGKPEVRILRIVYPADSECIVESKSLKLYLNSFNSEKIFSENIVRNLIKKDLENILKTKVELSFFKNAVEAFKNVEIRDELLIDDIDVNIKGYEPDKALLTIKQKSVLEEYVIYSNLLKTNCPVTGQPDWGTVYIKYLTDKEVNKESLLKYIISYRYAQDFHEACCEKIFTDIYERLNPKKLLIKCYYTRRGGIDINPVRFVGYTLEDCDISARLWRQ